MKNTLFVNPELDRLHQEITQKVVALNFDQVAYDIVMQIGEQVGSSMQFVGDHAGRSWFITRGTGGIRVQVDGETVLHQALADAMTGRYTVYVYREWPERDWLPAIASLHRLALERKRQKAIAATIQERSRFEDAFGPVSASFSMVA